MQVPPGAWELGVRPGLQEVEEKSHQDQQTRFCRACLWVGGRGSEVVTFTSLGFLGKAICPLGRDIVAARPLGDFLFFQLAAYKCKFLYGEEFCLTEPLVLIVVVLYSSEPKLS